ncbi:MAG: hypothetical protein J5590_01270 [Clostridia bacterium]|nr:hypothetical protein [Clostridia bacterium]
MKKYISILISLMVFLSSTAYADCFDFMKATYTSFEAEFDISLDIDSNFDFLDSLPAAQYIRNFVDFEGLSKGLSESEYSGNMKVSANEEFTKIQASFEMFSKVPVNINRNFKMTTESVYGIWIDYDITDETAPKIDLIYACPVLDKYLYIDMVSLLEDEGMDISGIISVIKDITGEESRKEIIDKIVDAVKDNSGAVENGSKVSIKISNEQLKELIKSILEISKESAKKFYDDDAAEIEDIDGAFSDFTDAFDEMKIFADDAIVIEVDRNADGTIREGQERINFAIDLQSIFESSGGTMVTEAPAVLDFSIIESVKYSKINQKVNVELPYITSSNSISFDELKSNPVYTADPDWDGERCQHEESIFMYGKYIPTDEGGIYCSLNDFTAKLRPFGYDYAVITDGSLVTLTEKNGLDRFTEAKISLDSTAVIVDGTEYSAGSKAIVSGKKICVDLKTLELIFGFMPYYAVVHLDGNDYSAQFSRKSPQCHHTQEEIEAQYTGAYDEYNGCDHFQYVYTKDSRPFRGKPFFALRDTVGGLFDYDIYDENGEYSDSSSFYELGYENGVITLTDLYGKESFNTVTFTNGSNEINIDGNIFCADNPVEIYDGTTYVDFSTVKALFGAEISYQKLEYNSGYFDDELGVDVPAGFSYYATLTRRLPTCTHLDAEPYER